MGQHTKGPWRFTDDFIGVWDADARRIANLDSDGSPYIGLDETLANAALIAAAPDLLAALEAVIDDLDSGIQDAQDNGASETWIAAAKKRLRAARAAIAKAKGTDNA